MKQSFALFLGIIFYMELVYHFACFGFSPFNPIILIPVGLIIAGFQSLIIGFFRQKINRIFFWLFLVFDFLIFASQTVYIKIFKQPLLIAAIQNAGGMALKTYWREALDGVVSALLYLILLLIPIALSIILLKKEMISLKSHLLKERIYSLSAITVGIVSYVAVLMIGNKMSSEFYEVYGEFYDPLATVERLGVLPSIQREMLGDLIPKEEFVVESWQEGENSASSESNSNTNPGKITEEEQENISQNTGTEQEDVVDTSPNVLPIDFEKLKELAATPEQSKLVEYLTTVKPTNKNEYTGFFEGYNLIYLTAEGFSPYAVDEQLTPTLYKMIHSGFVVPDYYVPLWQTSTSDGEYVNLTGLIPDQQFSMKRSAVNEQPFSLPAYFAKEGVKSYGYHNNTLSYYERNLSHPNLGYEFKASKLGELTEEEWGTSIFPMENVDAWPASDLDMMVATIPEYINEERFHVYYMTVSGHMNYNFTGNQMSKKNKEAVASLPYSDEGKAYIACNIELDKALAYLVEQLEAAGKLDKTVICVSADHYPYAMSMSALEELAGKPLEGTLEIYRNSLILWNSEMETVEISKTASALDLIPTLYNLFGFEYDSRLFAGKDLLSDSPGLVPFADRSFITDKITYYKKTKAVENRTEEITDEIYLDAMKTEVKNLNKFSSGVIIQNFYQYVEDSLMKE